MPATFTEHPILDHPGLPKISRRALIVVDQSGRDIARQPFNPRSGSSKLLARSRIAEDAMRLGVEVA